MIIIILITIISSHNRFKKQLLLKSFDLVMLPEYIDSNQKMFP